MINIKIVLSTTPVLNPKIKDIKPKQKQLVKFEKKLVVKRKSNEPEKNGIQIADITQINGKQNVEKT